MDFVAIDVETANADMASICQIGMAKYKDGKLVEEWSSLFDPEDFFDFINVEIHGITEEKVIGCPTFAQAADEIKQFIGANICACHTHFDRVSLQRVSDKYKLGEFSVTWIDSARVARRTWEECAWGGYGLANVCKIISHDFNHHDALEDAKACGQIVLEACRKTGMTISDWLKRVNQPIDPTNISTGSAVNREGNSEGELYGEVLVFTGTLQIPRKEAADLAASIGCAVASGVTKKITLLVVGDQDVSKLAGKNKSSKHLKVEQLISKGQKIRILKESDFKQMVAQSGGST